MSSDAAPKQDSREDVENTNRGRHLAPEHGSPLKQATSNVFLFTVGAAVALLTLGTLFLSRASPFYIFAHHRAVHGIVGREASESKAHSGARDILVLYIFANSDPEYLENLSYFVEAAVNADTRSEYVFLAHEDEAKTLKLPTLPAYAKYVYRDKDCFDWGTYGWYLGTVNRTQYKYFFFINCSVRGPFIPPMLKGEYEWWDPFVSRLSGTVKLAGASISCEGAPKEGTNEWRRNPHVQSFLLVTDEVGLGLMLADKTVFQCHTSMASALYYSELGSSNVILQGGYSLDCLMIRYQGVDWRKQENWGCNQALSPNGENYYDGITLDPYETAFTKVSSYLLEQQVSSAIKAKKYSRWSYKSTPLAERVSANDYLSSSSKHKVPKILEKIAHGMQCFDSQFYLKKNPDLGIFSNDYLIWKHFVYFGQFEPRQHRFTCPMNYSRFATLGKHKVSWQQRRLLSKVLGTQGQIQEQEAVLSQLPEEDGLLELPKEEPPQQAHAATVTSQYVVDDMYGGVEQHYMFSAL